MYVILYSLEALSCKDKKSRYCSLPLPTSIEARKHFFFLLFTDYVNYCLNININIPYFFSKHIQYIWINILFFEIKKIACYKRLRLLLPVELSFYTYNVN